MDRLAMYERLIATNPRIERKGDTMPYTSLNGHMFSVLNKDGIVVLRLPADQRDAFMRKYKTEPVIMYGALMKEYVAVPDALLAKTSEIKTWFDASLAYVASLKPKPTTRKQTAKSGSAAKKRK